MKKTYQRKNRVGQECGRMDIVLSFPIYATQIHCSINECICEHQAQKNLKLKSEKSYVYAQKMMPTLKG